MKWNQFKSILSYGFAILFQVTNYVLNYCYWKLCLISKWWDDFELAYFVKS